MDARQKRNSRPKLDRQNALKNVEYDASSTTSSSLHPSASFHIAASVADDDNDDLSSIGGHLSHSLDLPPFFHNQRASESKAQTANSTSFVALWAFPRSTTSLYPSSTRKPTAPTPTSPLASATISLLLLLLLLLCGSNGPLLILFLLGLVFISRFSSRWVLLFLLGLVLNFFFFLFV